MKETIINRVLKLFEVKSIVTFALIGTVCVLAARQNVTIPSEALVAIVTSVVTYFFTRKETETTSDHPPGDEVAAIGFDTEGE